MTGQPIDWRAVAAGLAEDGLRLARIVTRHSRESGPAGMVGDYCNECDCRWPCDTYLIATGEYVDPDDTP